MSAAAGIKMFGDAAKEALFKEFKQLHEKDVFIPRLAYDLTYEQRRNALRAINLINKNRNGVLKGRTCADGSVQRGK